MILRSRALGRWRRRLGAVTAFALGLTALPWLPTPAASPARIVPPTVVREVSLPLDRLLSGAPADTVRRVSRDTVAVRRPVRSAPADVCAPIPFTAIALTWDQRGEGVPAATLRVGASREALRRPVTLARDLDDGPDPGSPDDRGRSGTDILWVGEARCARIALRLPADLRLSDPRVVFVNSSGTAGQDREDQSASAAAPVPDAGVLGLFQAAPAEAVARRPWIIRRSAWGADERLRNCRPQYAGRLKMAFVHHTATENTYAPDEADDVIRSVYAYHTQSLGWCDIAYNFLVDRYGRVYEGRYGGIRRPVISAATRGFNTESVSVSALGNYQTEPAGNALVSAVKRILAWRMDVAHIPPLGTTRMLSRGGSTGGKYPDGERVRFPRIAAHRDAGYTSCPGDYLYGRLGALREAVHERGLPKIFLPRQSVSTLVPGQETVRWRARGSDVVRWRLQVHDGAGTVVRRWRPTGDRLDVTWDGTVAGVPLLPGEYTVRMGAGRDGADARPATFSLAVAQPVEAAEPDEGPAA